MKYLLLIVAISVLPGCASKGISVNASSENRDIFQNPEGEKKGLFVPAQDREAPPGRAPFINLSTNDWDYRQWLDSFSDRVADLRLPASADTYVEIRFLPGNDAPAPAVRIECTVSPGECSHLTSQVEAFPDFPSLPLDFPHPELVVKLSRVP